MIKIDFSSSIIIINTLYNASSKSGQAGFPGEIDSVGKEGEYRSCIEEDQSEYYKRGKELKLMDRHYIRNYLYWSRRLLIHPR